MKFSDELIPHIVKHLYASLKRSIEF